MDRKEAPSNDMNSMCTELASKKKKKPAKLMPWKIYCKTMGSLLGRLGSVWEDSRQESVDVPNFKNKKYNLRNCGISSDLLASPGLPS